MNNKFILFYSSSFPELSQEEEPQKRYVHDSNTSEDQAQKRDVKNGTVKPKKCDVISNSSSEQEKSRGKLKKKGKKHDVISDKQDQTIEEPKGKKHDVIMDSSSEQDKSRGKLKKKGKKDDATGEHDSRESEVIQIKKELDVDSGCSNSWKKDSDCDEIVFLGSKKTSQVSLRKSLRLQEKRNEQKRITSKLKEERSKKLAAKFILGENSITYRPPSGYYGEFGVRDHRGIGGRSPDVIEIQEETKEQDEVQDDDMFVDDILKHKVVLKKPK